MKKLIFLISISILLYSCSEEHVANEKEKIVNESKSIDEIDTYEERVADIDFYTSKMYDDSLNFDKNIAENLLKAYDRFIQHESYYSIAKEYMFKAGELCRALDRPHDAIRYFNMLLDRDPKYKLAPAALFYKALVVGDMLHEDEEAKKLYQEFIDTYPEHPLVESAKASIQLQGKDLNEVIKEFEKKNGPTI